MIVRRGSERRIADGCVFGYEASSHFGRGPRCCLPVDSVGVSLGGGGVFDMDRANCSMASGRNTMRVRWPPGW